MAEKQTFDESDWLPLSAIATLLNLSPRRVQQLAQAGEIPAPRKGHYALVPTTQGYARYLQRLVAARNDTVSAHTAEIQKQRAEKLKRENKLARDELIPRRDVAVGIQTVNQYIRSKLLDIPATAAPDALSAETVGDVKVVLQEHIHSALDELSRTRFVPVGDNGGAKPVRKQAKRRRKTARWQP
jgi:hypothetical protein